MHGLVVPICIASFALFPVLAHGKGRSRTDDSRERAHWAFQTPEKANVTKAVGSSWPRSEFDSLILSEIERQELQPSPSADRRTLVRRLYYDLIGLPPSYEEVERFVGDGSPDAYEKLVDELLGSEHFGERWARHWLDVARFGDTKGYVFNESRDYPGAYKYRDWVIQSINNDLPIDQFFRYQIAADHMLGTDPSDLAAMGYLTLGRRFINNQHDIIDDRIDVVFRGMMGLTVACARCHDHMYDPVTTEDYYSLYGVFASSAELQDEGMPMRLGDSESPQDAHVFLRGRPDNKGDIVPRKFLSFFDSSGKRFEQGSGRKELAEAIVSSKNPLTARVFVNRVWQHLMGTPIVATPSDFGMRTDPPVYRSVLDHLAAGFVTEDAWSLKKLVRRIATSSVYRQSSQHRDEAGEVDPANQYYWRANRKRLDFEAMRDSLLVASGRLDTTVGGPSVRIEAQPSPARRTLYAFIDRQNLPSVFRTFDFASPDTHSPQRPSTVVPQQVLYLLNSHFAQQAAQHLAERIPASLDADARIHELYRLVHARAPTAVELELGRQFLEQPENVSDLPEVESSPWQYGYGSCEGDDGEFHELPHYTGEAWQGGPVRPDPQLDWVFLTEKGGHPGGNQDLAAIRRWISPRDGRVAIRGTLKHGSKQGDGVRGRVVSSRGGLAGEWMAEDDKTKTNCEELEVRRGDTIDFVVDCRTNQSHDEFAWQVTIRFTEAADGSSERYSSTEDFGFHGPAPEPLNGLAQYAHTLLMTNEVHFLD